MMGSYGWEIEDNFRFAEVTTDKAVLPLSAPPDTPNPPLDRLMSDGSSKSLMNGQRASVLDRDQVGMAGSILSPMSSGRREKFSRLFSGLKADCDDVIDLEDHKVEKDREKGLRGHKPLRIHNQALLSGLSYCVSSCSMILVNKFVLSGFDFSAGISLMVYQNFVSVVVVSCLRISGLISTERLTWRLIRAWIPVNIIFVGMLLTSIFSLRYINVAMVTVLKNITNVITAIGETYIFKSHHGGKVWASLLLMIISAISGGITDLSFHAIGYTWQIINCFLTASYSLTRIVVDFFNRPLLRRPVFWLVITLSGFLGLAISFTSMWFLHQTGATTYSLVGSLNKIPLSIAGIVLFKVPTSLENSLSILFGLVAGVFFAKAKLQ